MSPHVFDQRIRTLNPAGSESINYGLACRQPFDLHIDFAEFTHGLNPILFNTSSSVADFSMFNFLRDAGVIP